jgi:hypothetical protein
MKVYDPDQVTVSFAGILMQGFADGSFVTVVQESDDFTDVVGTDGEVSRSKTNDRRATVTIKLMQTSAVNTLLSAISNRDRDTPGGAGIGQLMIRDRQGSAIYRADRAWISKPPDVDFDRGAVSREWTIRCAKLERVDGGN